MSDVLLVAACESELRGRSGEAVGIGAIEAAIGTARAIVAHRPRGIVFTGSAGAYRDTFAIGDAILASSVGWMAHGAALGVAYEPVASEPIVMSPALAEAMGCRTGRVLCLPAITSAITLRDRFAQDWEIEHLEAYAVARTAQAWGVPCQIVLGVANPVGPCAHAAWLAHRDQAEIAASGLAAAVCERWSRGLEA